MTFHPPYPALIARAPDGAPALPPALPTAAVASTSAAQRRARDADVLVAAARAGDAGAFDRLVRRFRPRIYALALHLSGSASDADDIAQDAFVQAYKHMRHFEGRSHFFTWLYRITVNRALTKQREQQGRGVSLDDVRVEVAMRFDAPSDPRLALELRETYSALLEGLDRLSSSLKSAVVLTALQGLSYQEAAIVLGTSEGAISVRIHQARKELRASLAAIEARRARALTPARADKPASFFNPELALALASVL
ncbi:MAG: polymerase sigma factor RpoE [Myxococcaceae bacterium]|nr:polymerase sigma factor RpoE [Myxococcaceae bacterium]